MSPSKLLVSCVLGLQIWLSGGQQQNFNQMAYAQYNQPGAQAPPPPAGGPQFAAQPGAPPAPPAQQAPVAQPPAGQQPPAAAQPATPAQPPAMPQPPAAPQAPGAPAQPAAPGAAAPRPVAPAPRPRPVMMASNVEMICSEAVGPFSCGNRAWRVVNPSPRWTMRCEDIGACSGMTLDVNLGAYGEQIEGFHFTKVGSARNTLIRVNAPYHAEIGSIECAEHGACSGLTMEFSPGFDIHNINMECTNHGDCFGCTIKQGMMSIPCEQLAQMQGNNYQGGNNNNNYPFMPAPWSPTAPGAGQWPQPQMAPQQPQWGAPAGQQPLSPQPQGPVGQPQPQYSPYGPPQPQYNPYAQYNPYNPYI